MTGVQEGEEGEEGEAPEDGDGARIALGIWGTG